MRKVSTRELSIHLFRELKKLPVVVTRFGKPYCLITRVDQPLAGLTLEDLMKDLAQLEVTEE